MADASNATFVYVTFIRTTPERLWSALTSPEFTRKYWYGTHQESEWKAGSPWRLVFADGRVADTGEVVEIDPPRRLVLKWRNEFRPEADSRAKRNGLSEADLHIFAKLFEQGLDRGEE